MFVIPKKVIERASASIRNFQKIAESHRIRDVSEADTVTLIKDILADVFGFDKYTELTSEQQIRGTFCDLAIRIDNSIRLLIEVKAAGVELNDSHLRQAINYAANQGIEWVILTNAIRWKIYRIKFAQPIDAEEVCSFDFTQLNPRAEEDQRRIFMLSREGLISEAMNLFHQHAAILNPYTVTQVILQEPVLSVIRREIRRIFPDIKVSQEELHTMMRSSILKREVIEGEKAADAASRLKKAAIKLAKKAAKQKIAPAADPDPAPAPEAADPQPPASEE
jgi:hypothetical protein